MIGNGAGQRTPQRSKRTSEQADPCSSEPYGPPHPLGNVNERVREVVEYARLYVEARKDMLRSTVRGLIWKAILGVLAGIAGLTIIIMAAVYLISGIAHGLGRLLGDEYWLGELITGLTILAVIGGVTFFAMKSAARKARERTIKKYERRQQQERERFGHSATERAQQLRQAKRS
jgi:hypothetical protein